MFSSFISPKPDLAEHGPASAHSALQWTRLGLAVIALTLIVSAWSYLDNARAITAAESMVQRTQAARLEVHALLSAMRDVGTGVRGFLLTGSADYLELHGAARANVQRLLEPVEHTAPWELVQAEERATTRRLIDSELAMLDEVLQRVRAGGSDVSAAELARVTLRDGKLNELRALVSRIDDRALTLLSQQQQDLVDERCATTWLAFGSVALGLMLVAVTFLVTQRQAALLQRFQRRSEQLESVVHFAPNATALLRGSDCVPLLANPAYLSLVEARTTGDGERQTQWPDLQQRIEAVGREVLATGEPYSEESCVELATTRAWFSLSVHRVPLPDGDRGLLSTIIDTTEQHRAARALKDSETLLRLFVEHAPASLAMFDRNMCYLAVSRRWRSDFDLGGQELIGADHYQVFPTITEAWRAVHQRALAGEIVRSQSDTLVRADGSVQRIRWEVRPWIDEAGAVGGIVIFSEDITELARAEDEARALAQWLNLAQAAAGAGTWQWKLHSGENVWSDESWHLYGLQKGSVEPSYEAWLSCVVEEDRPHAARVLREAADSGADLALEYRVRWPDGSTHYLLSRGAAIRDSEGVPDKYVGIVLDITERKRAEQVAREAEREQALRELSSRLSVVLEGTDDALALFDSSDRLVLHNAAYERLIGTGEGSLIGADRERLFNGWIDRVALTTPDLAERLRGRQLALQSSPRSASLDLRTRRGQSLRVSDRGTVDGALVETIWDLTEDERRGAELEQAYAVAQAGSAAKSEFLSSMSHELRTPLNAVLGFAQLLRRDTREPLSERQLSRVTQILTSGEHLLCLIEDVLDLSRIESRTLAIAHQAVDVELVVNEVERTLSPSAAEQDIKLVVDASVHNLPKVAGDRTRIAQALLNLGGNAIKYNRPGGSVVFSAFLDGAGGLKVSVRDSGFGIPEEKQRLLFQPFQRAGQENGPIKGTGIGLVITQRLAKLMGGDVGFRSVAGQGSEFWIELREYAAST